MSLEDQNVRTSCELTVIGENGISEKLLCLSSFLCTVKLSSLPMKCMPSRGQLRIYSQDRRLHVAYVAASLRALGFDTLETSSSVEACGSLGARVL